MNERQEIELRKVFLFMIQQTTVASSAGELVFKQNGAFELIDGLIMYCANQGLYHAEK